jgi:hypothetical protein
MLELELELWQWQLLDLWLCWSFRRRETHPLDLLVGCAVLLFTLRWPPAVARSHSSRQSLPSISLSFCRARATILPVWFGTDNGRRAPLALRCAGGEWEEWEGRRILQTESSSTSGGLPGDIS